MKKEEIDEDQKAQDAFDNPAELEKPHALLCAFREAFPTLKINMQNVEME